MRDGREFGDPEDRLALDLDQAALGQQGRQLVGPAHAVGDGERGRATLGMEAAEQLVEALARRGGRLEAQDGGAAVTDGARRAGRAHDPRIAGVADLDHARLDRLVGVALDGVELLGRQPSRRRARSHQGGHSDMRAARLA